MPYPNSAQVLRMEQPSVHYFLPYGQETEETFLKASYIDKTKFFEEKWVLLTLKLPGEGQMALPFNLNDKKILNADFFLVL